MAELYLKEGIAFIRELSRNMNAFLSRDNFIRVCIEDFQPKKLYIGIGKPPLLFRFLSQKCRCGSPRE